jgi:pimeloyl-ACP methyl ester carboxylesterase
MRPIICLRRIAVVFSLLLTLWTAVSAAVIPATIDTDEHIAMPVPHRYLHGVIPDDAKFQLALPDNWNGKLAIFSRGFSGTELTTGSFKTTALQKGYAFASSDEGWNRRTIANRPQDSYFESRRRIRELTLYAKQVLMVHYGRGTSRTLMMGGSNGGHHTKWMVESYPDLYDGGIAGYGFNSQVSQWGSIATVLRNYDVIASRIDDIIKKQMVDPLWDSIRTPLTPPLTPEQLKALQNIYDIPATLQNGFKFNVGRWKGSEAQWKSQYNSLLGYLRDSMARFDETFHPHAGSLTDDDLKLWEPAKSPKHVQKELRKLDLSGNLKRSIIIMHGSADPIVSPGESEGYAALVERRLGKSIARKVLAIYYIPGMGHGGMEYDKLIGAQIDALEQWIDYRKSGGKKGALPPKSMGAYPRALAPQGSVERSSR